MDFFTLDTILRKRFFIFFIIHLQTRQIVRHAVTTNPTRQLVRQQLTEFTWDLNSEQVYLIHDGSGEFVLPQTKLEFFLVYVSTISMWRKT